MTETMVHNVVPQLHDLLVPISELRHYPGNARRHADAVIRGSLVKNGQYKPITVNLGNRATIATRGTVLAGNGTLAAARELGWTHIAVTWNDKDDEEAAHVVAVDNRSNDLAYELGYEDNLLADLLQGMSSLEGSGYDQAFLDELLASTRPREALTDPDHIPEPPAEPVTTRGDVWLLGPHRLVCGDSRESEPWEALLGGHRVDCVWTDPPYGVEVVGGSRAKPPQQRRAAGGLEIKNDDLSVENLTAFLTAALSPALAASRPGAAWYVTGACISDAVAAFVPALQRLGVWRHTLVWAKDRFVLGPSDYHYRHELIYYGWKPGAARHPVADRTQDTVWEIPRPRRSEDHPTMKPVELVTRALENSTKPGALVLDPFAGSGSTLIACHQTGRTARLIELDPRYVDVTCRRWQEHTGIVPILEATGREHDFTGGEG